MAVCSLHPQAATNRLLSGVPGGRIVSIQFVARNVMLGTTWCSNRWLLTLNSTLALREFHGRCLDIEGEQVNVRCYDNVLKEEYRNFMNAKIKQNSAKNKIGVRR